MKSTPIQIFSGLFWLVTLTDLLGMQLGFTWLHVIAKPLLMPLLIGMLFYSGIAGTKKKWILIGLFFSWLGDLFLLLDSKVTIFFIAGLGSFLITHIFYILYFLSIENSSPSLLKKQPLLIVLTLCYGSALVVLLFPYLGDLKIPVILYAAVICTMLLCSLHIFRKLPAPSNSYFVAGALLFVLSDSLLAINKFYQPFAFAGTLIMLTYCAAQFYIVMGFIKRR
jgi:uncharacterized membrane protein YhhN